MGFSFLDKTILILGTFIGNSPSLSLKTLGNSFIMSEASSLPTAAKILAGKFGDIFPPELVTTTEEESARNYGPEPLQH